MKIVVFLGPSLPTAQAREVLPGALYLPPARQSDLLSAAVNHKPDVIALVDGEFGQALSVWHKEILFALERGIRVYGSSSMGALRAAETDSFGMRGVGEVYRMYASGEINDDDEVALAHGMDEEGYRALSEPMVNVRVTFAAACRDGAVSEAERDAMTAAAKALYFPERTLPRIFRAAAEAGVEPDAVARMRSYATDHYVDQKRLDALELLAELRDLPDPLPAAEPAVPMFRSALFQTLYNRDRTVPQDGVDLPLAAISDHAALHLPGFNELNQAALNRALVGVLGDMLEVQVTEENVDEEAERFRFARRLSQPAALEAWLAANHLDADEFRALMREQAVCRALQRWMIVRKSLERTCKTVLDELRLRGQYEEQARRAASQERVLAEHFPYFRETSFAELTTRDLVIDHLKSTPCRMDTAYPVWAEDAGFHRVEDLRVQLLRARVARDHVNAEVAGALAAAGTGGGAA
ncbi:MAG: hypothetical protein JWM27_2134 [Gemmatimonadetes bacterium]|nr:hypothetical protein [Gemmatimonadota bacterium]